MTRGNLLYIPLNYVKDESLAWLNGKKSRGRTPLMIASYHGHKNIVEVLIQNNANITVEDDFGASALFYAALNGHKDIFEILLENSEVDINKIDTNGMTALIYASVKGHKETVEFLLQNNANINAKNHNNETALVLSARKGHKDIVEILVHNNAYISDYDSRSTLIHAAWKGYEKIVDIFIKNIVNISDGTALILASGSGKKKVIENLLQKNVYINAKDKFRRTALMHAVSHAIFLEISGNFLF